MTSEIQELSKLNVKRHDVEGTQKNQQKDAQKDQWGNDIGLIKR